MHEHGLTTKKHDGLIAFIAQQVAIGKQLKQVLDVDERIGFIAHVSCPSLSDCPQLSPILHSCGGRFCWYAASIQLSCSFLIF